MPLYENSVIYKLVKQDDYDNENIYIGSTTNFRGRKSQHKSYCSNPKSEAYNYTKYQYIRENGGFDNFSMIQIEPFPCNSKKELESRERYWIEILKPTLNKCIPTRTIKEWYDNNKYELSKKNKIYNENNKDIVSERSKIYYENNKDKVKLRHKIYNENNKEKLSENAKKNYENNKQQIAEKVKIYQENNKQIISEKAKIYRENNREKLSEKEKTRKLICECGCEILKKCLSTHQKSPKHQKLMLEKTL
tara:strand:- start:46 stop:792 length:747 start_codon:yes stop_codon:yes gene_type:complete